MIKRKIFAITLILGLLLVVLGGVLLAERIWDIQILSTYWPLAIAFFGMVTFLSILIGPKALAFLAIPGTILLTLGLLLFFQATFDLWGTWTYAWALLCVALGIGLLLFNCRVKADWLRGLGGALSGLGLVKFLVFGAVFEKIVHISNGHPAAVYFYIGGLIAMGVWVILSPLFFRGKKLKVSIT
ncbi:MAG: hypothetical protein MUO40_05775 [Anaerolineaceae bacterium]|nr:hypothetical protein [Anaerolineaceae bacterium]